MAAENSRTVESPSSSYSFKLILGTGFAMFSMFFGAGNLIFPLTIGASVQDHYPLAILGFVLTGVLLPFLGLLATVVAKGSYEVFFAVLGKWGGFLVPLCLMLLLGPFGATPRAITVAYGSLITIFPDINVYVYAVVSAFMIYYLVHDRNQLVSSIGYYLTPVLLLSLTAIILFGIFYGGGVGVAPYVDPGESFIQGFLEGYQTMDLLAAFFFAVILIDYIKSKAGRKIAHEEVNLISVKSLGLGAFCLFGVYVSFIFIGATFSEDVLSANPEQALAVVARLTLGPYAAPIVCIAYVMACLTTTVALISAFSEFIYEEVFRKRISLRLCIIGSIIISCLISTLRFSGIIGYLAPIVQAMYLGIILITILHLLRPYYEFPYTKPLFYVVCALNAIYVFGF